MRVLFIGDNSGLSKEIKKVLSEAAIETDILNSDQELHQIIQDNDYHLIILGSGLSDSFRIGFIGSMRKNKVYAPIMVLSAGLHWYDKVTALETGADACLELPCPPNLLVAYVKAIIRRDQQALSKKVIQIEQLYIDTKGCSVRVNDTRIQLTADEYKLLLLLAEHEGFVVSRIMISQALHYHDDHFGDSNIPEVYVCRIRKKIRQVVPQKYIKTVHGVGYMLCVPEHNNVENLS